MRWTCGGSACEKCVRSLPDRSHERRTDSRSTQAAQIINLVGGVRQCRSPLARQLVKNLLYHDVLSSSSRKDGLLVDYSFLRTRDSVRDGGSAKTSPASATPGEGDGEQDRLDEEDEEDVLDTLMGAAEGATYPQCATSLLLTPARPPAVFLLIARITNLAKEKRQALKTSGGAIAEDDLSMYMRKVEEIKYELEREKDRMDSFLVGACLLSLSPLRCVLSWRSAERPDLEPHRYFHEVGIPRMCRCDNAHPVTCRCSVSPPSSTSRCCSSCRRPRIRSCCSSVRC